jgi:hypothetical protein
MRQTILGMWAVLLGLVSGVVQATPITYVLSFAHDPLTGTITTDGTMGALDARAITGWSFQAAVGAPSFISSIDPGANLACAPSGCGFTAEPSILTFASGPKVHRARGVRLTSLPIISFFAVPPPAPRMSNSDSCPASLPAILFLSSLTARPSLAAGMGFPSRLAQL